MASPWVGKTNESSAGRSERGEGRQIICSVAPSGADDIGDVVSHDSRRGLFSDAPPALGTAGGLISRQNHFGMGRPALRAEASIKMKNAWPSAEMPGRSKRGAPATP